MNLKDKHIVITGGSSGVGQVLAKRLIKKGAHLALVARDEKKLLAVKKEISDMASSGPENQMVEIFA